ncbi:hypothetical protein [Blastococcus mobilis]|uniref:Uncharacterized protein n=1 Tax=Blastococcus mobilis TaxID=1938746 RepID=A0A238W3F1_9ACTN|nr:hypothetical protein [Blastococcus mobilis]SNR41082.1 hypothetical protein SAMN06272737_10675 [Blastococcus mobilis]
MDSDERAGSRSADSKAQADTRRWLARLVVVAIGLWFIVDGLRGAWPGAGVAARGALVAAVLLGVALLVLTLRHLLRRGRGG